MTVGNMWEVLKIDYPTLTEPLVLGLLEIAQREFCSQTQLLTKRAEITNTGALTYSLPDGIVLLKSYSFLDEFGALVGNYEITVDKENGTFIVYDRGDASLPTLDLNVKTIVLVYDQYPTAIGSLNQTPDIDSEWQMALVYKVKMMLGGNNQVSLSLAARELERIARDAKRYGVFNDISASANRDGDEIGELP
jgi:hypothetical protein